MIGPYHLDAETRAKLLAESARRREALAQRRAERETPPERRAATADRRSGSDRRFATMDDRLAHEASRHGARRFTGAALTDFGLLGL